MIGALGALYAGATLVPVSTRLTGHEALDVISRSGARALMVAGPFLGTDRLAALRSAHESERDAAGPDLARLSMVVRIPVEPGELTPADGAMNAESAVVGMPDARLGEVGKAFVVPRPGHNLGPDVVVAFCRERLANYKVPRQVVLCESLPRNASGKVLKRVLREQ